MKQIVDGGMTLIDDLTRLERLRSWLRANREHVDLGDVYGPSRGYRLALAGTARRAMHELERRGAVARVPGGMVLRGRHRREVWSVRP